MTFFFGIYALLMMTLFPGALLLRCIRLNEREPLAWSLLFPLCFGLSLLVNYFLVLTLTLAHLYQPNVIRGIGILEGLLFVLFYYRSWGDINLLKKFDFQPGILFSLSWLLVGSLSVYWLLQWGQVFGPWDATVSYNRWAVDWAQNMLPSLTWHYPQLLPTNWSLAYVMMGPLPDGVHLEAFPAAIQGFFPLGILLFLLAAFYQKKNPAFLLSLILVAIVGCFFSIYLTAGYADIPVTFFNFGAVMLLLRESYTEREQRCLNGIGILFALAAALTKPAGIYSALAIPLLQYLCSRRRDWRPLVYKYGVLLLLILPWYLYATFHESSTAGFGDIWFLLRGAGFENNVSFVFNNGRYFFPFLIISFLFKETLPPKLKWVFYVYCPYLLVWGAGFAYDLRNLFLFFPLLCLTTGLAFYNHPLFLQVWQRCTTQALTRFSLWWLPFGLAIILFCMSFQTQFQQAFLIQTQIQEKNQRFVPAMIARLTAYSECPQFKGAILTNYVYFAYLPFLTPSIVPFTKQEFGANMQPNIFESPLSLKNFMTLHPDIRYLLLNERGVFDLKAPDLDAEVKQWQSENKITLEWNVNGFALYHLQVDPQNLWANS